MKSIFFVTALLPIIASAQIFGPSNYQDCILKGLESAKTDTSAKLVMKMCMEKFPEYNESAPSTLIKSNRGKLLCDSGYQGYPPWLIIFERTQKTFVVNETSLKIYSQTKGKIYAKDGDNLFLLNLETGLLTVSNKKARVDFHCEIAK